MSGGIQSVYNDWNEFFVRNDPEMRSVVSPNTDTLLSLVLFDLRARPALIQTRTKGVIFRFNSSIFVPIALVT